MPPRKTRKGFLLLLLRNLSSSAAAAQLSNPTQPLPITRLIIRGEEDDETYEPNISPPSSPSVSYSGKKRDKNVFPLPLPFSYFPATAYVGYVSDSFPPPSLSPPQTPFFLLSSRLTSFFSLPVSFFALHRIGPELKSSLTVALVWGRKPISSNAKYDIQNNW